jgi:DNA-binding response OmpR family regulator
LGTLTPAGQAFSLHNWLKQYPGYKDVPLLVIDARPEERLIKGWRKFEGVQLESEDYVTKPIEPVSLMLRIQRLLEEATRRIRVLVVKQRLNFSASQAFYLSGFLQAGATVPA